METTGMRQVSDGLVMDSRRSGSRYWIEGLSTDDVEGLLGCPLHFLKNALDAMNEELSGLQLNEQDAVALAEAVCGFANPISSIHNQARMLRWLNRKPPMKRLAIYATVWRVDTRVREHNLPGTVALHCRAVGLLSRDQETPRASSSISPRLTERP